MQLFFAQVFCFKKKKKVFVVKRKKRKKITLLNKKRKTTRSKKMSASEQKRLINLAGGFGAFQAAIQKASTPEGKKLRGVVPTDAEESATISRMWQILTSSNEGRAIANTLIACGKVKGSRCSALLGEVNDALATARAANRVTPFVQSPTRARAIQSRGRYLPPSPKGRYNDQDSCEDNGFVWNDVAKFCRGSPGSRGTGRSPLARLYRNNPQGCADAGGNPRTNGSCAVSPGEGKWGKLKAQILKSNGGKAPYGRGGSPRAAPRAAAQYDDANPWA